MRQIARSDRKYQKWRRQVIAEQPLCTRCQSKGITAPTEELHHIEPFHERPDLVMDRDNVEPLCFDCHKDAERDKYSRFIPCDIEGNPLTNE